MGLVKRARGAEERQEERRSQVRDRDSLLAALNGPDSVQRYWAARDLAHLHGATQPLFEQLRRETDAPVREAIATALITTPSGEVAHSFVDLLRTDDAALRNLAIEALQQMPDHAATHVDALLVDADADIRIFAVNIISVIRHPRTREWLRRVLESDPHVNVCAAAIDALADAGDSDDVGALARAGERFSNDPYIVFAVGVAAGRLAA